MIMEKSKLDFFDKHGRQLCEWDVIDWCGFEYLIHIRKNGRAYYYGTTEEVSKDVIDISTIMGSVLDDITLIADSSRWEIIYKITKQMEDRSNEHTNVNNTTITFG